MADEFYVHNGHYCGNAMLFHRKGLAGYTSDVRDAAVMTKDQAFKMHASRSSDLPWPKDCIDQRTQPMVDIQKVNRGEALRSVQKAKSDG